MLLRLGLQPLVKLVLRQHLEKSAHAVMPQTTKLRADNLELSSLGGREMYRDVEPRNDVLLNAQFGNVEGMNHVLRVHGQQNGLVHRDGERTHHDIVASGNIIGRIEPVIIPVSIADLVWMDRSELAVGSRVTEPEGELFGLQINAQRIGIRRREINRGPHFRPDEGKRQYLN